jgi:ribosomal protein L40E
MPILEIPITKRRIWVPALEDLAIPAVSTLIIFLAYTSQYLFYYIEPGPLGTRESIWFNVFVGCIWVCYDRACTVDPGRKGWVGRISNAEADDEDEDEDGEGAVKLQKGMRWCKKCDAVKPPRAHHCRKCARYSTFPHCLKKGQRLITADVSQKWTTIVPGPQTASLTPLFRISYVSFSTP